MKKAFLVGLLLVSVIACDDDNDALSTSAKVSEARNTAVSGEWRITKFVDSGTDETNHFNGYTFQFGSSGSLTATNSTNTYTGTWSVTDDGSGDDNRDDDFDDIDFNIIFTLPADFAELSEDWEIVSLAESRMEFRHVSGGNGGTDLLTFEKM
jgi:hypothetical protein